MKRLREAIEDGIDGTLMIALQQNYFFFFFFFFLLFYVCDEY